MFVRISDERIVNLDLVDVIDTTDRGTILYVNGCEHPSKVEKQYEDMFFDALKVKVPIAQAALFCEDVDFLKVRNGERKKPEPPTLSRRVEMKKIEEIRKGDEFVVAGELHHAAYDAALCGDAEYSDQYVVYSQETGDGFFAEDLFT